MVSFSCENCGDVCTKKKLDGHARQCRGATFTCLDCMRQFPGNSYRDHTSCISEAQKYQGSLYREKANKSEKRKSMNGTANGSQAMVPRKAYVEDAMEGAEDSQAVAVVDVPPRAPTPPRESELPANVNVFDFLVSEETPRGGRKEVQAPDSATMIQERSMPGQFPSNGVDSQYSQYSNGGGGYYSQQGFSYGHAPLAPEFARYDSYNNLIDSQNAQAALMPPPPPYVTQTVTPAPKEHRKDKSEKKRKRHVEDLDLTSSSAMKRPSSRDEMMLDAPKSTGRVLHSGLTGGLSKLVTVTDNDFYNDRIDAGPTPVSPIKRSKRGADDSKERKAKDDRRKSSYTPYTTTTSKAPSSSKYADDRHSRSHRSLSPQQSSRHHSSRHPEDDRDPHRQRHLRQTRDSFSSTSSTKPHRKTLKQLDYNPISRPSSVQPTSSNQVARSSGSGSRADLFTSFVTKGPESERGYSVNKLLKRYHRERDVRGEEEKGEEDKELWRGLRLRRNSRGEIVLFAE